MCSSYGPSVMRKETLIEIINHMKKETGSYYRVDKTFSISDLKVIASNTKKSKLYNMTWREISDEMKKTKL